MKNFVFLVLLIPLAAALIPASERVAASPASYDLTCAVFSSPLPIYGNGPGRQTAAKLPFYPVPGAGGPDGTDETGHRPPYSDGSASCGWISRAYRSGEATTLCSGPSGQFGADSGRFITYNVYNDGRGCMVVVSQKDSISPSYPDVPVVCHGPLSAGSAPAAAFYSEVEGRLMGQGLLLGGARPGNPTLPGGLAALPAGACAASTSAGTNQLRDASFCVADDQDQAYKNQLQDLLNARVYQMTVHANPGCSIYEKGTLAEWSPRPALPQPPLPR